MTMQSLLISRYLKTFQYQCGVNPYVDDNGQCFVGKYTSTGGNIFANGYYYSEPYAGIRYEGNHDGIRRTGYYHQVVTVEKISSTQSNISIYENGTLVSEGTVDAVMGDISGKPWTLGQDWDGATPSDFFKGEIDELAFFGHTLSESEIDKLYDKKESILAYYSFDDGTINDLSGSGNDGTNHDATFTEGHDGKAICFSGTNQWAELTDFDVPDSFSIAMWLNPHVTDTGQCFIGKHTDTGGNIFLDGYWNDLPFVRVRGDSNQGGTRYTGYHHHVVTVEKTSSTQSKVTVYKDGVQVWQSTLDSVMGDTKGRPWCLGQDWDDDNLTNFFDGEIDELVFYDHALTTSEVAASKYTKNLYENEGLDILKYEEFIETKASYTGNGNYLKSQTDSLGNTVRYDWDETKGILNSTTDAKGSTTNYSYDNNLDQMTSVSKDVGSQTITNTYSYDDSDRLSTINHNGFDYTFTYDALGNNTKVNVGNQNLITRSFEARTSLLTDITYGNGQKMIYSYDDSDRVKGVSYDDGSASELRYEYEYDAAGNLGYHNDLENDVSYKYIYDLSNRLTKIKDSKGNVLTYGFDENNKVSEVNDLVNGTTYTTGFDFDKDSRVKVISYTRGTDTTESTSKLNYSYDLLGRVPSIVTDVDGIEIFESGFEFTKGLNGSSSVQLQSMTNTAGSNTGAYNEEELSYTYDSNGNILTITVVTKTEGQHDETKVIEYEYNELNEVVRENNEVLDKTMTYSYDLGGNILSKSEYAYTTESLGNPVDTIDYVYGDANWKDKLTSYDGNTMTYDEIGNLETFDGNTYTWEEGRRLKSITNANQNISYMYNASGIRTSKTVDGVTTDYHLVGDKVTLETDGTNTIYYTYDASGKLISMNLTNTTYPSGAEFYYIRNAQGDITGLYDDTGKVVVEYSYDTWGKPESATDSDGITGELADTVGKINPYRYRGYRYDSETGMYYLQSRYYNPEIGRFINADGYVDTMKGINGTNMFTYCGNNPISRVDLSGTSFMDAMKTVGHYLNSIDTTLLDVVDAVFGTYFALPFSILKMCISLDRFDTIGKEANESAEIHAENVINIGIYENYVLKDFKYQEYVSDDYEEYCKGLNEIVYLTTKKDGRDLDGIPWDELSDTEKGNIIGSMYVWDGRTRDELKFRCFYDCVGVALGRK